VIVVRRGGIVLTLLAAAGLAAGCGSKKDQDKTELKGTVTFGVLAPVERTGELGTRAKDLTDGAKLAVAEINERGGVLGKKLTLDVVDDACSAPVAYEAAKSFLSDGGGTAGVIGGMCDEAAEREVPVIDSTGIPFLVTSANSDDLVNQDTASTYLMNGTVHQQALSAVFWMNYRQAARLAVLQDSSPESKELARQAIGLVDQTPKVVGLQTVDDEGNLATIAKATLVGKPDFVYWTGAAKTGGALAKALKQAGYKGTFTASAGSESPDFLAAAGPDGAEGAFVTATASGSNTPTAAHWAERFKQIYKRAPGFDALQAYDAVRTLAHAIDKEHSTDGKKMLAGLTTLDANFTDFLGVVRFARDHTQLYDNRVILQVKDGKFAWNRSLRTDALQ
jgi:branched-chain amino acid transport system substrate-binding protein